MHKMKRKNWGRKIKKKEKKGLKVLPFMNLLHIVKWLAAAIS
jgi:hypothetical protein